MSGERKNVSILREWLDQVNELRDQKGPTHYNNRYLGTPSIDNGIDRFYDEGLTPLEVLKAWKAFRPAGKRKVTAPRKVTRTVVLRGCGVRVELRVKIEGTVGTTSAAIDALIRQGPPALLGLGNNVQVFLEDEDDLRRAAERSET